MRFYRNITGGVFSLPELLVVAVALSVVGAIVGPRMSRAASSSPDLQEQILVGQLASLRTAIAQYACDHDHLPGPDVEAQLLHFSDAQGHVSNTPSPAFPFGPYLREIPAIPLGPMRGLAAIKAAPAPDPTPAPWTYNPDDGSIHADLSGTERDATGLEYRSY